MDTAKDGVSIIRRLIIDSPKRNSRSLTGWEGFFPYYAGYPEAFARQLIESAKLPGSAMVLDPWNGSGTTTYTAGKLGLRSTGLDLNPVMVIIARARLLPTTEADSLDPLAREIIEDAARRRVELVEEDPLLKWFAPKAATTIRSIEQSIERHSVGSRTITPQGVRLDKISGTAATLYAALFAVCRNLASRFRSSNPTWVRYPKDHEQRLRTRTATIEGAFRHNLRAMADALEQIETTDGRSIDLGAATITLADTTTTKLPAGTVDLVLTSPPYCTRIDYAAATRIELAVLWPLLHSTPKELGRRMIGSTNVPGREIEARKEWGKTCTEFLDRLSKHESKASSGYYYKTHLDYFDKMDRSIGNLASAMKPGAIACLIVQDSYYKEIHNNLPQIIAEIGEANGLNLLRRVEFKLKRSMSGINPYTRTYSRPTGAVEEALCFQLAR